MRTIDLEHVEKIPDPVWDHVMRAFAHAAGLGPHPGKPPKKGPAKKKAKA